MFTNCCTGQEKTNQKGDLSAPTVALGSLGKINIVYFRPVSSYMHLSLFVSKLALRKKMFVIIVHVRLSVCACGHALALSAVCIFVCLVLAAKNVCVHCNSFFIVLLFRNKLCCSGQFAFATAITTIVLSKSYYICRQYKEILYHKRKEE